ncbi:MAG: tetratricopeptide repeat protein [Acidobacteria bacterium]|nr:tetratricopeptide repeat protein [Acidobacteriota bacterium]
MSATPSPRDRRAWSFLLVLVCLIAYANGMTGTFTYDDKAVIRDNPRIRTPARIGEIFATPYFGGPRGSGTAYRPVLLLSYAAQWWVHGRVPEAFHLVNVLLHAAATLLLGALLVRVGVSPAAAGLTSLFFAVAPIHVEAVTSLVGRGETLGAVFLLAFLHVALGLAGSWRRFGRLLAALALYALGVLTKESAAVAPALLFLLLAWRERGGLGARLLASLRRGLPVFGGAAVVLAGTFVLRSWVLGGLLHAQGTGIFEVENPLAPLAGWPRVVNACLLLVRYAGRTLFPLHLSADESAWSIRTAPPASFAGLAAVGLLALLAARAVGRVAKGSHAALGVLFFGVAFLPAANVLYPIGTIFGERTAYLPSAGLCLALASVCARGAETLGDLAPGARAAAAVIAVAFSARTVLRNPVWWSDSAIFANSVNTSPESAKTHYNQGYIAVETGRPKEALAHYARAVSIYGDYWDAWAGKGRAEKELGLLSAAEASYRRALEANPTYENGFFGLGVVLEARGRFEEAEAAYRRGLASNPDSLPLAYRLAVVVSRRPDPGAAAAWKRALELGPRSAAVHADRADWLLRAGRPGEARQEARAALRLEPRAVGAHRVLARLAASGRRSLAEALAREKAWRASGDAEDLRALEEAARENRAYGARFERVLEEKAKGEGRRAKGALSGA